MTGCYDSSAIPLAATIAGRKTLSSDTMLFRLQLEDDPLDFHPGQFVQLSVPAGGEAPISLAGVPRPDKVLELCIRRVGHVTDLLHRLPLGAPVGIRGPLGRGFPLDEWRGHDILLLAGGLGMAPLRSLLLALLLRREEFGAITLMYGAREPSALLFKEELAELSNRRDLRLFLTVDFVTEAAPGGLVCNTGLLPSLLKGIKFDEAATVTAVCGPPALYRCVGAELQEAGIPAERIYLSLERRMKCGIGRCCHCAVGDRFCCTDGPVFRYSELHEISGAL